MLAYAARRLLIVVPLAWGVATAVFLLMQWLPGEPFHEVQRPGVGREAAEHLRTLLGTDRPLWERYGRWLAAAVRGDLGVSLSHRRPVAGLLAEAVRNTALLAGLAIALQYSLGLLAGFWAAASRRLWVGRALGGGAALVYALPSFWVGLALVWTFSVRLGWLPASQMRSIDAASLSGWSRWADALRHLTLPCLALALPTAGGIALYVRETLGAVQGREFMRAARSRGVPRRAVLLRHGMRNVLLPVTQLLGLSLPGIVGGSVVIEVLFAWPGMGRLAWQAVLARDEPLILGCTLLGSAAVLAGSLVADLAGAALDPRFREETA